jgi:hypothetical protein
MRLDAERSSTYRIFTEYRADRPELQLEKRAAPALKVLLDATRGRRRFDASGACRWKGQPVLGADLNCSEKGRASTPLLSTSGPPTPARTY